MQKFSFIYSLLFMLVVSCSTLKINNEQQQKTEHAKILGSIGEQKDFLLEKDYNPTALPNYQELIKIKARLMTFNKKSFKTFKVAKESQNKTVTVSYVDSIAQKPKFLKLEIADRVTVLEALKSEENKAVLQFLLDKEEAQIISSISLVLNENQLNAFQTADEVFLQQTGIKNYALVAYKDKIVQQTINFNDGVVFAYQSSNFCWKQNDKYQVELIDIVETNDKCPNRSYTSAKKAKKNINYFKL